MIPKVNSCLFFIFFFYCFSYMQMMGQCDKEEFLDQCADQITGYTFLKASKITLTNSRRDEALPKVRHTSLFKKGNTYIISVCTEENSDDKIIVNLIDREGKTIATNYLNSKKFYFPYIIYHCNVTGYYHLEYFFRHGNGGCGVSILGFKGKEEEP